MLSDTNLNKANVFKFTMRQLFSTEMKFGFCLNQCPYLKPNSFACADA